MDAPPPYNSTMAASATTNPNPTAENSSPHKMRNGIPVQSRRSMEDESRPLPHGWIRQFDPHAQHQFFVDTSADPPRSTWQHPYDDETYMSSLPPEERAHIRGVQRTPTKEDIMAESSGDDDDDNNEFHNPSMKRGNQSSLSGPSNEKYPAQLPRQESPPPKGMFKLGRKMKDKITSSTHEEREQMRQRRAIDEQEAFERHQKYRDAMAKAAQTGEPQLVGRDEEGKDVYIEPPRGYGAGSVGCDGPYPGQGGPDYGGIGYQSPYQNSSYGARNARYIKPPNPYFRPHGYGYGGGLGLPLGMAMGGGLLAGSMLF